MTAPDGSTNTYGYDTLNRLNRARVPPRSEGFRASALASQLTRRQPSCARISKCIHETTSRVPVTDWCDTKTTK